MIRNSVGFGKDSHAFLPEYKSNQPLILGGVLLSEKLSFRANSDGDVILHAIFNAISQAIGERSIGFYADEMCLNQKITDSQEYLKVILKKMNQEKFKINNLGIMIEASRPKLEPYCLKIKKSLAQILNLQESQIGLTFTSGEGLTAFGRGEGMKAEVVCSLVRIK